MPDRLYLSFWTRRDDLHPLVSRFETMVRTFPISRLSPRAVLRQFADEIVEPPAREWIWDTFQDLDEAVAEARAWHRDDSATQLESFWDLFQSDQGQWKLAPSAVSLWCFGSEFRAEYGEQLRIEFGLESAFLPDPEDASTFKPIAANIRSLLTLTNELADKLEPEKRLLWSESGGNFAERLQEILAGG